MRRKDGRMRWDGMEIGQKREINVIDTMRDRDGGEKREECASCPSILLSLL